MQIAFITHLYDCYLQSNHIISHPVFKCIFLNIDFKSSLSIAVACLQYRFKVEMYMLDRQTKPLPGGVGDSEAPVSTVVFTNHLLTKEAWWGSRWAFQARINSTSSAWVCLVYPEAPSLLCGVHWRLCFRTSLMQNVWRQQPPSRTSRALRQGSRQQLGASTSRTGPAMRSLDNQSRARKITRKAVECLAINRVKVVPFPWQKQPFCSKSSGAEYECCNAWGWRVFYGIWIQVNHFMRK